MAITSLALLLAITQRSKDQYTLGYTAGQFVVRKAGVKEIIPVDLPEVKKKVVVSFRRDKRWAVWDERGLSTRDGSWTTTDRLGAVAVSPKIQSKEQIVETQARLKSGRRTKEAVALSGSLIIGNTVYLLPRWEEADGTPWLEALIAIDLGKPHPKPQLLGTFGGLSLAQNDNDSRMSLEKGLLTVAVNKPDAWGLATYDRKTEDFAFKSCGTKLFDFEPDGRLIEGTSYGTTLVGRWADGRTIPWLETRGEAAFVPGEGPVLVRVGDRLRNAVTGAELKVASDAMVRRSKYGVVVFWPQDNPRSARLVEPTRFEELARWESGTR